MRRKIKTILAVTLAVCMTLSGTVMAFAETSDGQSESNTSDTTTTDSDSTDSSDGTDSGSSESTTPVKSLDVDSSKSEGGEADPPDSAYATNVTSDSCQVNSLYGYHIDSSTKVTIDGKEATQTGSRVEEGVTYYTYSVKKSDSSESKDDSKSEDTSDDSKNKDSSDDSDSDDSDSDDSQFAQWSPAPVSTAAVTVGNVTTATVDPSSSNYSSDIVSMIAKAPMGGTLDLNITSGAYIDEAMINALAVRGDVSLNLTVNFMGVSFVIHIPAGYNLSSLLGADGRIDFAKLIATFKPVAE